MPYLPGMRESATLLDVFKVFPEVSDPLIRLHEPVLRGPSPFSDAERELIASYVSGLNRCRYCHGVHSATTTLLGIPASGISDAIENIETAPISNKMRPVLHYARKLTERPDSMTQADADAILAVGWPPEALFFTVAVTALFNFMNRAGRGIRD